MICWVNFYSLVIWLIIPKQVFLSLTRESIASITIENNLQKTIHTKSQDSTTFPSHIIHDDFNTLIEPIPVESIILGNWKASENHGFENSNQKIPRGLENDLTMIDYHPFTSNYKGYHLDDVNSVMSSWDEFENPRETTPKEIPKSDSSEEYKVLQVESPLSIKTRQPDMQDCLAKDTTRTRNFHIGKYVELKPASSSKKIRKSKALKDILLTLSNDGISIEATPKNWSKKETCKTPDLEQVWQSRLDVDLRSVDVPLKECVSSQKNNVNTRLSYPGSASGQQVDLIQQHSKHTKQASKPDDNFSKQLGEIMRPVGGHVRSLANFQLPGTKKELKDPMASKEITKLLEQYQDYSLGKDTSESRQQLMVKGLKELAYQTIKSSKKASGYDVNDITGRNIRESKSINVNNDSKEPFKHAKGKHVSASEAHVDLQDLSASVSETNEYKRRSDAFKSSPVIGSKKKYLNSEDIRKIRQKNNQGFDRHVEMISSTPAKLLRTKKLEDISDNKQSRLEIGSQAQLPGLMNSVRQKIIQLGGQQYKLSIERMENFRDGKKSTALKNDILSKASKSSNQPHRQSVDHATPDIQPSGSSTDNGKSSAVPLRDPRTEDIQVYEKSIQINSIEDWGFIIKNKRKKIVRADDRTDSQKIFAKVLSAKVIPKQTERKPQFSSRELTVPSTHESNRVLLPLNKSCLIENIKNYLKEQGDTHRAFRRSHKEARRKTRDLVFTYANQGKQIINKNKELFKDMSRTFGSVEKFMNNSLGRHLPQLKMKTFSSIVSFKAEHVIFPIFIRQVSWICQLTQDLSMLTESYKIAEKFTATQTVFVSANEFFRKWLIQKAHDYLQYVEKNFDKPIWKHMNHQRESPQGDSPVQLMHHLEFATEVPKWTVITWNIFWEWLKGYDSTLHELIHIEKPKASSLLREFKMHYARDVMQQIIERDRQFLESEFCHEHKIPKGKFKRSKRETLG